MTKPNAAIAHFLLGLDGKDANTESREGSLYLHGNLIAQRDDDKSEIWISNAGWKTQLTQRRLNELLNKMRVAAKIATRDGQQYIDHVVDGKLKSTLLAGFNEVAQTALRQRWGQ